MCSASVMFHVDIGGIKLVFASLCECVCVCACVCVCVCLHV